MFVAGWRHALRSEWPFIIIIIRCISEHTYLQPSRIANVVVVVHLYVSALPSASSGALTRLDQYQQQQLDQVLTRF